MAEKKAGQAELLQIFPFHVREILMKTADDWEEVQELRLRSQKPLFITVKGQEYELGTGRAALRFQRRPFKGEPLCSLHDFSEGY